MTEEELKARINHYLSDDFKGVRDRIDELRKDVNYNDQQTHQRINIIVNNVYTRLEKVELDNATRDAFYSKLVEENKQLKKEIENLNKKVNMMWNQIDRLERDKLDDRD